MANRVSATDAKNTFGSLIKLVSELGDPIVIENRREAIGVLISMSDFAELERLRKEKRIQEALEALQRIRSIQAGRNADLSEDESLALAVRAVRETRDAVRTGRGTPKSAGE